MKNEVRVLGLDDSPFEKGNKFCVVIGTFMRASGQIDGFLCFRVIVDGNDATDKIIKNISNSRFFKTLKAILIDGISLGGFNIIDINRVASSLNKPVIVIIRKKPNMDEVKEALITMANQKKLSKKEIESRLEMLSKAGPIYKLEVRTKSSKDKRVIYFQKSHNISLDEAREIIKLNIINAFIPESIRISHLIGSAIVSGESKGGA